MDIVVLDNIPFKAEPEAVIKAMRVRKTTPGIEAMVRELCEAANAIARPKALYRVSHMDAIEKDSVVVDGVRFRSRVLGKCFKELKFVYPSLNTCGTEIEEYKVPPGDMMRAYCLDTLKIIALGASLQFLARHLVGTFSLDKATHINPGEIADWPITEQRPLFSLLGDTEKAIGAKLTESCVIKPEKSRSGFYFETKVGFETCMLCVSPHCPGRRMAYSPVKVKEYTAETVV